MSYEIFQQGADVYIPVLLFSIVLTIIVYAAFPFCFAKLRKKEITKKKYNIICFCINFLVMIIFKSFTNGDYSNAAPYFLWTSIFTHYGSKILSTRNIIATNIVKIEINTENNYSNVNSCGEKKSPHICLSNEDELVKHNTTDFLSSDIIIDKNNNATHTDPLAHHHLQHKEKKTNKKFCSLCGNEIDSITKKCIGCGKQYFKGIKLNKNLILTISLTILVISVSYLCAFQFKRIQELDEKVVSLERQLTRKEGTITNLEKKISDLENEIWDYKNLANFIDMHVVFVEDDGTKLYHKYECYKFKGEGFWAFNTEAAISQGYNKCSVCH